MPPTNSTSPVPTRLRTPSTSVMMRATSVPGAILVVVGHRQQPHVPLHLPAHLGNQPLPGL